MSHSPGSFLPPLLAVIVAALVVPTTLQAQTRGESTTQAKVAWLDQCPLAAPPQAMGNGEGVFTSVFAKLAGDVVGAGVNALGEALEAASREYAFTAAGLARFNYYELVVDTTSNRASIVPAFNAARGCLALSMTVPGATGGLETGADTRPALGLDAKPHVYLEARLISGTDGFHVQPVYFAYLAPIPGAPKKPSQVELHLSFAVPAAVSENGGRGTVFALAQIALPRIKPGDTLNADALRPWGSAALAHRSRDSIEALRAQVQPILAGLDTAEAAVRAAERRLARANVRLEKAADPKTLATLRNAVYDASDALEDRKLERIEAEVAREDMLKSLSAPTTGGLVTAQVRVSVIRDANKFGLAIAQALKTRSAEFGTALATHLTAVPPPAKLAWTAADTTQVQALSAVALAERSLAAAQAAGDADAILERELALRNARALANQAAAAAGKPLPYPNLGF